MKILHEEIQHEVMPHTIGVPTVPDLDDEFLQGSQEAAAVGSSCDHDSDCRLYNVCT